MPLNLRDLSSAASVCSGSISPFLSRDYPPPHINRSGFSIIPVRVICSCVRCVVHVPTPTRTELISSRQQRLWWQGLELAESTSPFAFKCTRRHLQKIQNPKPFAGKGPNWEIYVAAYSVLTQTYAKAGHGETSFWWRRRDALRAENGSKPATR
jgi:hypothetical protein